MTILQSNNSSELQARLAKLEAENEALKQKMAKRQTISFKVSEEKGCLSVYGLGRFPVTLYGGQWERLAKAMPELLEFIEENRDSMTWKE
jgi:hypothetical protein